MGYAETADVLARAGMLGTRWTDETHPSSSPDIERFLDSRAGIIDGFIAKYGFAVPVTSDTARRALLDLNAAGALVLALEATPLAGRGEEVTQKLLEGARKTWETGFQQLMDGTHPALGALQAEVGTDDASLGGSLWTDEPNYGLQHDPRDENESLAPFFWRGQPF